MRCKSLLLALFGSGMAFAPTSSGLSSEASPPATPPTERALPDCGAAPVKAIYFDADRNDVRPDQKKPLDRLAAWLSACPSASILLEGHTDDQYTEQYATAVSVKLAESVRDYLLTKLPEDQKDPWKWKRRIGTIGLGRSRPATPGNSETNQALNRRVEVVVRSPK